MNKTKRKFNYLFLTLSLMGIISGGMLSFGQTHTGETASADFSSYSKVSNSLPDYFSVNDLSGNDINNIFLLNASNNKFNLSIATEQTLKNPKDTTQSNPVYYTQEVESGETPTEYYYFDFTTSLSLYKDISNTQLDAGVKGTNLLDGYPLSDYTTMGQFPVETGASFTPKKLYLSFGLNTTNADIETEDQIKTGVTTDNPNGDEKKETVILNEEGIYTLVIPTLVYYTNNNGATFTLLDEKTIQYTFMVFNSDTYFKSSGIQNVDFSKNLESSNIMSSETYSTYYFYNYSDATEVNSLPTLTYDYTNFKINVRHTDTDDNATSYFVEYQNGKLVTLDASGKEITNKISIDAMLTVDALGKEKAKITFIDLGEYDINFEYLYLATVDGEKIPYELPLNANLTSDEFKNKSQKVLIYGYQALHSNYSQLDETTNQPTESELKTFNFKESKYDKSADITSLVNKAQATTPTTHQSTNFDLTTLEGYVETYLASSTAVAPVSTNQPPVKFVTNATLAKISDTTSAIYSVNGNTLTQEKEFVGFNQNTAGTYVYIIQYQYDQYLSASGISQGQYYHYQIFYFTITNKAPSVTVYSADETDSVEYAYTNFNELYTRSYTNKNVFIINNAEDNAFDAQVTITLSAYNYTNKTYYFPATPLDQLHTIDSNLVYEGHKYNFDGKGETTKKGVLIKNTASYANAKFTITISSALSQDDSVQTFTIDTRPISNVNAYNVDATSSANYVLSDLVQASGITNRPIAITWSEKEDSGAKTFGYLKHIPFINKTCYPDDKNSQSNVIYQLLNSANMLPVSSQIDLSAVSDWSEYANTSSLASNISATNVRTDNGIYILQVYDQAGNNTFKIFMIDKTSPVFVKATESARSDTFEIIQNSSNITIPQDDTDIFIQWGQYKGIYIGTDLNLNSFNLNSYQGFQWSGITSINSESFEQTFYDFLNDKTQYITNVSQSNLIGHYIMSEISSTIYVKDRAKSYSAQTNSAYRFKIDFFKIVNGEQEANEGNCKIIVRDASNSYVFADPYYSYLNFPSAYISFNITSDLSQFTILEEKEGGVTENLEGEAYSLIADLYKSGDEFTTDATTGGIDNEETDYRKKFSYLPSINTTNPLHVSYIPLTSAGTTLDSVNVAYYPYETGKDTDTTPGVYYYYYTIAKEPTIQLTLFKFDSNSSYEVDTNQTSPLNFGQTDEPLAGKYVITRTYQTTTDANTLTKSYDFFSRQITFYVDTNGIISPLTSVSNDESKSSLESLIGGDIVLNVHSGEGNSSISVAFPTYSDETGLNSGSFYSKNSFSSTSGTDVKISLSSNKLPLSLYIPKFKYTVASIFNNQDKNGNGKDDNNFILNVNRLLSYYGHNLEINRAAGSSTLWEIKHDGIIIDTVHENELEEYLDNTLSMTEYELSADITFVGANNVTKYFATKHNPTTSHYELTNNYLTFYETSGIGVTPSQTVVTDFYEPGTYYVTLYQNANDPQSSMYSFYRFAFEITSSKPEYDLINQEGYNLEKVADEDDYEVYYTNSDTITIQWTDPTDPYLAKIDKGNIVINGKTYTGEINTVSANTYSITIPNCVETYKDAGLPISFQYEGHNDDKPYYHRALKKIFFDVQAPTENLEKLIDNVAKSNPTGTFTSNLQKSQMRVYTDYTGATFNPLDEENKQASYITNADTGMFKYYAFSVKSSFFSDLYTKLTSGTYNGKDLSEIYYQKISNIETYSQSTKYTYINNFPQFSLGIDTTSGNYYEIIETDWAGNRTIYVVYLIDEENTEENTTAISYTSDDEKIDITNQQIEEGYNIYANTNFAITKLSFNQDPWLYFTLSINNNGISTKRNFFKSPFLADGLIYEITYSNGIASYSQVNLEEVSTVTKSSQNKHLLTISNQAMAKEQTCYITVLDSSLVIEKVTENVAENKAIIGINVPTAEQVASTTKGYVYPVCIEVYTYDVNQTDWKNFAKYSQQNYGQWTAIETKDYQNFSEVTFSNATTSISNKLLVSVTAGENTKVKYIVTDNFGKKQTILILTGNNAEETISSVGQIYTVHEEEGTVYISNTKITYTYNTALYSASVETFLSSRNTKTDTTTEGKIELSPTDNTIKYFDGSIKITLYAIEDTAKEDRLKNVYLRIYNILPNVDKINTKIGNDFTDPQVNYGIIFLDKNRENIGENNIKADTDTNPIMLNVRMDGKTYAGPATTVTTYSKNVTVQFPNGLYPSYANTKTTAYEKAITFSTYLSRDGGQTWQNIDGIETVDQPISYTLSGVGTYTILIVYNDSEILTNAFKLYEVTILDAASSYYYITVNGQHATKSNGIKYSLDGTEYEVTYVVALDYADRDESLKIHKNEELGVIITEPKTYYLDNEIDKDYVQRGTIITEIYSYYCQEARGEFVIIYIPKSTNIVGLINYELASGETASLKNGTNAFVVADKNNENNFDKLKISFSSFYGVKQNAIQPIVYKVLNGQPVKLDLTVYKSTDDNSYIYLEMSGTYYLQVLDSCTPANSQVFNGATYNGYEYVEITFLSDVPFEVVTTNENGEEVITAPIEKAIYNSEVKIRLTNTSIYYLPSALLTMSATRNGEQITVTPTNNVYTFSQPGYYTVKFSATSSTGVEIREESYNFTIINKNESRYAFEFAEYGDYYIEKVIKDGRDVTEDLLQYSNFKTVTIGSHPYLSSITLNHLDEKTGDGRYEITININNPEYASVFGERFSFSLWINLAKPPITVSIAEGGSTTKNIIISLNVDNFYNTVGDCYLAIGSYRKDYTAETITTLGTTDTISITASGTYYIQVYTQSGHLLFSYKVTKTEPLNTFAILAIVLGVLAVGAIVFITIKLRKRQKVK